MTTTPSRGITADQVLEAARERFGDDVGAHELSVTYESMQAMPDRKKTGVFYTPKEVAQSMSRIAMQLGVKQCGPRPDSVLAIVACDPACGAGVFLVEAAHVLSTEYARRLSGDPDPSMDLVVAVMPRVILNCIFGIDIDPVAVELSKLGLSLQTGGILPPYALDRHIVCGNALANITPPAMDERTGPVRSSPPEFDDAQMQM